MAYDDWHMMMVKEEGQEASSLQPTDSKGDTRGGKRRVKPTEWTAAPKKDRRRKQEFAANVRQCDNMLAGALPEYPGVVDTSGISLQSS